MKATALVICWLLAQPPATEGPLHLGRPDLTGHIVNRDGDPVEGATVYIYTAGVRTGTSPFCPSCYADCGKREASGGRGTFAIRSLDPELIFRVLVVAEGYEPTFVSNVDPAKGPIEVTIQPVDESRFRPGHVLRGRVIDSDGDPVVGATVSPFGVAQGRRHSYGRFEGIDSIAITNARGEFVLTCTEPDVSVDIRIAARGLAPQIQVLVPLSDEPREFVLGPGATVTGRVVVDGKPLPGVALGLAQTDRSVETFVGNYEIGTDKNGRFSFLNVKPNDRYFVYGIMNSLKNRGAIAIKEITVGGHGSLLDIGALGLGPGHRLTGRVVLSDGGPVPAGTRLLVSRKQAWDTQTVFLDDAGGFAVVGLPPETFTVSVQVTGYHLSPENRSWDPVNPFRLVGRIHEDIADVVILLEPGSRANIDRDTERTLRRTRRPHEEPLRGVTELHR